MKPNKYTIESEKARRAGLNRKRKCMAPNCNNVAINSHVLQKNGILNAISKDQHLYQFKFVSQLDKAGKGLFELKRIGINDAYSFPGFCSEHDSNIFKAIEQTNDLSIYEKNVAQLLSYRTLCNELRAKEIAFELSTDILMLPGMADEFPQAASELYVYRLGQIQGLNNFEYFKSEFETEIFEQKKNWEHYICEIPKLELCISSVLTVEDLNNEKSIIIDETATILNEVFVTSVINIFPYQGKSYVVISVHKNFLCNWTMQLFEKFKNADLNLSKKLISDLIVARVEFWCLSEKLFNTISQEKLQRHLEILVSEMLNHSSDMQFDFNLFE